MKGYAYDEVLEITLRLDLSLNHPYIIKGVWLAGCDEPNSEILATESKLLLHLLSLVYLRGYVVWRPHSRFQ
jgi:hypothetical protein